MDDRERVVRELHDAMGDCDVVTWTADDETRARKLLALGMGEMTALHRIELADIFERALAEIERLRGLVFASQAERTAEQAEAVVAIEAAVERLTAFQRSYAPDDPYEVIRDVDELVRTALSKVTP